MYNIYITSGIIDVWIAIIAYNNMISNNMIGIRFYDKRKKRILSSIMIIIDTIMFVSDGQEFIVKILLN